MNPNSRAAGRRRSLAAKLRLFGLASALLAVGALWLSRRARASEPATTLLTPKRRETYDRWRTEKIAIPAEAWDAKPFSEATLEAARKAERIWRQSLAPIRQSIDLFFGKRKFEGGFRDPKFRLPVDLDEQIEPFLRAIHELAARPDYGLEIFMHTREANNWGELPIPNVEVALDAARLARMNLQLASSRADENAVINNLGLALRISRLNPYAPATCRQAAISIYRLMGSAPAYASKARHPRMDAEAGANEQDPETRAKIRDEMREVSELISRDGPPMDRMSALDPWVASEELALLREYYRLGLCPKLASATRLELAAALWNAQAEYLDKIAVPRARAAGRPEGVQAMAEIARSIASDFKPENSETDWMIEVYLRSMDHPNEELQVRAKVARVKIDMRRPPPRGPSGGALPPGAKPVS